MQTLGRYELLRPLARGGMGEVYLARRRVGGVEKRLVIKRLRRDHASSPRMLELFVREAQLSMGLVQQNIVPVFDFGRIGDDVFLAMEHIDGVALSALLAPPLPAEVVAHVGAECAQALGHAHRHGVVHRDVSPRNVLVSWDGEVKLIDFGIAALHGADGVAGTPGYLAPEQARGEPVDARADLYALGMVLWEAVTGQPARPGATADEILAAARTGTRRPYPDDAPAVLRPILERVTAAAPDDRYPEARSLWRDLDRVVVAARHAGRSPIDELVARLTPLRASAAARELPALAPGALVGESFLDDGAAAVLGRLTHRSIAETVGDAPAPAPAPPPAVVPAPRRRPRWPLIAAGLIAAAGALVLLTRGAPPSAPPPTARPAVVASVDAGHPTPDAARPVVAPLPDAARPFDARPIAPHPRGDASPGGRPALVVDAAPAASVAPLRWVTLGARPWAYVTVDDEPTRHETPVRLQLRVGPHRLRYANPELGVSREVTVVVPPQGELRHVEDLAPAR